MSDPGPSVEDTPTPPSSQEPDDTVRADLPLSILVSVRAHDRPMEVLEEEDLASSLPRRLGLTGVVESQIHRYTLAQRRNEKIPLDDVANLLKLVLRRPDAEAILREAGNELARHQGRRFLYRFAAVARVLPDALCSRLAQRAVRRLLRRVGLGGSLQVARSPLRVEIPDSLTARIDDTGTACILYSAAIGEAAQHALGLRPSVEHPACRARGDESCVWEVE